MSSRTYLSIGDVLTLLREEFPDVTISKIRFLESQGLVNPERSPSGYRKFFDHDVERLRWVLRQQREHFLPLKVIRDRLADGDLDDESFAGTAEGAEDTIDNGKTSEPARAAAAGVAGAAGPSLGAAGGTPGRAGERSDTDQGSDKEDKGNDAMARILADASRRAARLPDVAPVGPSGQDTLAAEHSAAAGSEAARTMDEGAGRDVVEAGQGPGAPARSRRVGASAVRAPAHDRASGTGVAPPAAGSAGGATTLSEGRTHRGADSGTRQGGTARPDAGTGTGAGGSRAPNTTGTPSRAVQGLPTSVVTGASLTAEELCSASGLSAEELAELEGFGLVEAVPVAGLRTYDENALTVANLAASFRAFGIEPRHLRLYRIAMDREMGLIEQVVIPLLRQRNPESRQRAVEAAEQLAALGQSMRASLVHVALRRHLGG